MNDRVQNGLNHPSSFRWETTGEENILGDPGAEGRDGATILRAKSARVVFKTSAP